MKVENGVLVQVEPGDIKDGSFHSWEGITSIGEWAFSACASLESIELPPNITSIGSRAFQCCESLKSIELPPNITSIGSYAFFDCESLKSIELPPSIAKIEEGAFERCKSLESIKLSQDITEIEEAAFSGCNSLESIELPPNITSIGIHAFVGCTSLKYIKLSQDITKIEEAAFSGCKSLESIELPPNITSIGIHAFVGCTSLKYIKLPPSIAKIEESAFSGCKSLESIALPPNITRIGESAFRDCKNLKSMVLSPNITKIEEDTFTGCISLEVIYIPACDDATRARIINLLPEELRSKVAPAGLLEKILSIRDRELQRIVLTPYTNPMGRIAKSGLPIPDDILKEMNGLLGEDNRFLSKARSQIDALPLPSNADKMSNYQQKVHLIVDKAIAHSKRRIAPPVMPEVLDHLKGLEDKASDLSNRGEEEAATALQGLCEEVLVLLYDNLDANAFLEKCKQAIEEKREVLGGVKSVSNSVGSDPAFFKTNNPNLLDALIETIEQKAPNQSPSQSSR